jgi:hypothetical protein
MANDQRGSQPVEEEPWKAFINFRLMFAKPLPMINAWKSSIY